MELKKTIPSVWHHNKIVSEESGRQHDVVFGKMSIRNVLNDVNVS